MKIASTGTCQRGSQKKREANGEQDRNFWIALLQGTFMRISFALVDSTTVLAAFIYRLTGSNTFVGLAGSIMPAGWMWPQLLISNLLEHRSRKMPFYVLGMSIRMVAWLAIILCTLLIGSHNDGLLAASFLSLYFIAASAMGVSTIPYMDIISKSIEPQRRARFFSLRNFTGGIFGIFIGFLVRYILGEQSGLVFPNNYALLFGCATVTVGISFAIFLRIREPIHPVQNVRRSFWQHLKLGPHFLRTDRNYRLFLFFRFYTRAAGMCIPFYVPYALLRLGVPDSSIGSFITVTALSGVVSNALWGYLGERCGVRWILIGGSAFAFMAPMVAISVRYMPLNWQGTYFFLVFALSGAAMSGTMVGFMSYMLNLAPPLIRPTYLGFMNTVLFPFSFMSVVAGKLVQFIHYEGVFTISVGMGILGSLIATRLEDVYYEEGDVQPMEP